ncbi:alpha/beta hydrolase-fold protein [Thermophagus xiamenensis]|uniref:Phospholipase/Carboxylesterase n=1 Tax=Thermophagus xiamenensis TaxID=385682 RepID=A0A1I2AGF9_9BACT|nr:alpha/beta hydrolase-fold protein [Thermophagus xiamenensis]SFE42889.1 Phospholipase/Carboxylesterase [Thermophagus xiamenensis]
MRKLLLLLFVLGKVLVQSQNIDAFQAKVFVRNEDSLIYRILYPEKMEKGKKYPLILFLHGAGERGTDNKKQLTHGSSLFVDEQGLPTQEAIVLFPQCPPNVMWTHRVKEKNKEGVWEFRFPLGESAPRPAQLVNLLVEDLMASGQVDTNHMYVMGLSMGGIGTLEFLYRWPEKYAAAICICGGHDPALAEKYCHVPVWFFHGGMDDVVPSVYSRQVFEVLKKCNVNTRYMLYSELNHNSWDAAFSEPGLLEWLLSF